MAIDPNKTVYISYRREDKEIAFAIYQYLVQRGFDVFVDISNIPTGADFRQVIFEQIYNRTYFIILMSASLFDARIAHPSDFIRIEIEYALSANKIIIPILLENFPLPHPISVPASISPLLRYNAIQMLSSYFDITMERLVNRFLIEPLEKSHREQTIKLNTPPQPPVQEIPESESLSTIDTTDSYEQSIAYLLDGVYFALEMNDLQKANDNFRKALALNEEFDLKIENLKENKGKRQHIFLSYSRVNTDKMVLVKNTLVEEGFNVWTDENLKPGTPIWETKIQDAIELAQATIVLLSPNSKGSEWVIRELGYSRAQRVPIFALLIAGDESTSIPFGLTGIQYVDIRTAYLSGMLKIILELREKVFGFK